MCARAPLPLRVVDRLMPSCLLESLQAALGPSSPFWEEHRYPTSTFFSYTVPLSSGDPAKCVFPPAYLLHQWVTSLPMCHY